MSNSLELFARGVGIAILMAVLTYLSNSANLTGVFPTAIAAIIASLEGVLDKSFSADGTVAFGAIGRPRQ